LNIPATDVGDLLGDIWDHDPHHNSHITDVINTSSLSEITANESLLNIPATDAGDLSGDIWDHDPHHSSHVIDGIITSTSSPSEVTAE